MKTRNSKGSLTHKLILLVVYIILSVVIGVYVYKHLSDEEIQKLQSDISKLEGELVTATSSALENDAAQKEKIDEYIKKIIVYEDVLLDAKSQYGLTVNSNLDDAIEDIIGKTYKKMVDINIENKFQYAEITLENPQSEITNYDEIVDQIFTENGLKKYEKENELISRAGDKVYISAGDNNSGEYYWGVKFKDIKITDENTIECTAVRNILDKPLVEYEDTNEEPKYTERKDKLVLKKVKGIWLIDDFTWNIETN